MHANIRFPYRATLVTILAALCFGYGYLSSREGRPRVVSSADMPPLYNEDGSVAALSAPTPAKPLLLFLLSTDCPYCAETSVAWRDLATRVRDAQVAPAQPYVLSISSVTNTRSFLREYGLAGIPVFYVDDAALGSLGVRAIPSTILHQQRGDAHYWDGVLSTHDVETIANWLGVGFSGSG